MRAVESRGGIALCSQHEGRQDVAGCEEGQLHQSASRWVVVVAAVAGVHGQVAAHGRGGAEGTEAPHTTSASHTPGPWAPSSPSATATTSRGRCVRARVLFLPLGPTVLEPDLDLCLGQGKGQGQVEALAHRQVARGLELVLQRHQLLVGKGSPGPARLSRFGVRARALPLGLTVSHLTPIGLDACNLATAWDAPGAVWLRVASLGHISVSVRRQSRAALLAAVRSVGSLRVRAVGPAVVLLLRTPIGKAVL